MKNKEDYYDKEIAPIVSDLIAKCKSKGIGMFANFQYSNDGFCQTLVSKENHSVLPMLKALSDCAEEGGVNIDKFIIWVMKEYPNKSSMVLKILGNDTQKKC